MINIENDSVVYCDIPYEQTSEYTSNATPFDYPRFYTWCANQTQPTFISSYQLPEEYFAEIAAFGHTTSLSANKTNHVVEKLFIPNHQKEWLMPKIQAIQLSLF